MAKERKVSEDEVESLMREVQDADGGGNNNNNNSKTSTMKETVKGSSTVWKVLVVILMGLLMLFATDSIELKTTKGKVEEGVPKNSGGDTGSDSGSANDTVTEPTTKATPKAKEVKDNKKQEQVDTTPVVYENETPRITYKTRGQPMPDALRQKQTTKWGEWKPMTKERQPHDFYKDYPNRDVPRDKFPSTAWQLDKEYMTQFLTQGKDLVMRAMEAILAEYGHGVDDEPGVPFSNRSAMFNLRRYNVTEKKFDKFGGVGGNDKQDGGWTTDRTWGGLQRRILHAIMTEDAFIFAMAGHSASAGHG
jgi:hypothetical protein